MRVQVREGDDGPRLHPGVPEREPLQADRPVGVPVRPEAGRPAGRRVLRGGQEGGVLSGHPVPAQPQQLSLCG